MPAGVVKKRQEKYWDKAKDTANARVRAGSLEDDSDQYWAFVNSQFQKFKSKELSMESVNKRRPQMKRANIAMSRANKFIAEALGDVSTAAEMDFGSGETTIQDRYGSDTVVKLGDPVLLSDPSLAPEGTMRLGILVGLGGNLRVWALVDGRLETLSLPKSFVVAADRSQFLQGEFKDQYYKLNSAIMGTLGESKLRGRNRKRTVEDMNIGVDDPDGLVDDDDNLQIDDEDDDFGESYFMSNLRGKKREAGDDPTDNFKGKMAEPFDKEDGGDPDDKKEESGSWAAILYNYYHNEGNMKESKGNVFERALIKRFLLPLDRIIKEGWPEGTDYKADGPAQGDPDWIDDDNYLGVPSEDGKDILRRAMTPISGDGVEVITAESRKRRAKRVHEQKRRRLAREGQAISGEVFIDPTTQSPSPGVIGDEFIEDPTWEDDIESGEGPGDTRMRTATEAEEGDDEELADEVGDWLANNLDGDTLDDTDDDDGMSEDDDEDDDLDIGNDDDVEEDDDEDDDDEDEPEDIVDEMDGFNGVTTEDDELDIGDDDADDVEEEDGINVDGGEGMDGDDADDVEEEDDEEDDDVDDTDAVEEEDDEDGVDDTETDDDGVSEEEDDDKEDDKEDDDVELADEGKRRR